MALQNNRIPPGTFFAACLKIFTWVQFTYLTLAACEQSFQLGFLKTDAYLFIFSDSTLESFLVPLLSFNSKLNQKKQEIDGTLKLGKRKNKGYL